MLQTKVGIDATTVATASAVTTAATAVTTAATAVVTAEAVVVVVVAAANVAVAAAANVDVAAAANVDVAAATTTVFLCSHLGCLILTTLTMSFGSSNILGTPSSPEMTKGRTSKRPPAPFQPRR